MLFSDPSHIPLFLTYLNSRHPNIEFTHEIENNRNLNFLDICVTRNSDKFSTNVFKKSTFTGLGLKFDSYIPSSYKIN